MFVPPEVKAVLRLNRETGKTERLEIKDAEQGLLVTLPGGTGDLFKYDTGPFAGVTEKNVDPSRPKASMHAHEESHFPDGSDMS